MMQAEILLPTMDKAKSKAGELCLRTMIDDPQQYYLYIPDKTGPETKLFITIHGIKRKAKEHATKLLPYAKRHGVVLIAPLFPRGRFSDYQQLGLSNKGIRADLALNRIIDEVGFITGVDSKKLYFFGYSGGGQFVHRYAMTHPQNVARMVIAAAGWYTFPDYSINYPHGLKNAAKLFGKPFNPEHILKIPTCVLVGEQDVLQDKTLRKSTFLNRQQGSNRIDRGRAWIQAMKETAKRYHLNTAYDFMVIPRSNHSFLHCMDKGKMGQAIFKFLFGSS